MSYRIIAYYFIIFEFTSYTKVYISTSARDANETLHDETETRRDETETFHK